MEVPEGRRTWLPAKETQIDYVVKLFPLSALRCAYFFPSVSVRSCRVLVLALPRASTGGQKTGMDLKTQNVRSVHFTEMWERSPCQSQNSDCS